MRTVDEVFTLLYLYYNNKEPLKQGESTMHNQAQLDILYKLKKEVEKSDHTSFVNTINQIIKKVYLEHYTMTFVGHFSAGKSTVINRLIGQDILPSSPVPTTSNTALVTVSDEAGITANIEGQKYTHLKTYDDVKRMNQENYHVESIDIRFKSNEYRKGFTFQDTPGVDSNVQSHSASTESFLYTSNMVFYTVDYNHVQSALNFQFMKRLNHANIPVVFVINQIDKHQESEIMFETFKSRVEKSINEWEIDLVDTFYITKYAHPENQFEALKAFIHHQDTHREPIENYVDRMTQYVTQNQAQYLEHRMDDVLERLNIEAEAFDTAYEKHLQNETVHQESQLLSHPDALKADILDKRKNIIDNAYVMTYDTREHIRHYLESMTKDFKVGGWFQKQKKIEEARATRLNTLMNVLQTKVTQEIAKPMREEMSYLTRFIQDNELNQRIVNQDFQLPETLVTNLYQKQIQISNQYVLTFSDDLLKRIRQLILRSSESLDQEIVSTVQVPDQEHKETQENVDYDMYIKLRDLKLSLETKNYRHYYIHIDDSLDQLIDRTRIDYTPQLHEAHECNMPVQTSMDVKTMTWQTQKFEAALNILHDVPLYQSTLHNIRHTLERMENQIIKIGVFGTFSAGKSSLINALLGDQYLVSSPNPTTAATTEISYGNTNTVTFKSKEALLNEINHVTELVGHQFDSIDSFLEADKRQLKAQIDKNRLAFINAIEDNYALYESLTQQNYTMEIAKEEISKWSAEDQFATFVNTVHIQLPLEWLKDKIIVDSLGLHSNNQRHTNETEKILTTSDLILYVSYFNHSFTDNDKVFIQHMKDMNQLMDNQSFKMIVNATDLAENESEKTAVLDYVNGALNDVGMTPEIFGVSSRNALFNSDTGIETLKKSIQHFTDIESKSVLASNIERQFRYIYRSFITTIQDFESNALLIEKQRHQLQSISTPHVFENNVVKTTSQKTKNEIEDQMYHLQQRLHIQLLDDVKSVFNGQMTNTDDFKKEKVTASKMYLDQIQQKLYLEQTLLVERMKKFYTQELNHQLVPTLKTLQEHHVLLQKDASFHLNQLETAFLKIDLESFVVGLPKQLTKKRIIQPHAQKEIQEVIKDKTLQQLQHPLKVLNIELMQLIEALNEQATVHMVRLEELAQKEIQEVLSFKIDDALIQQLRRVAPKLKNTLKIEDEAL